MKDTTEHGIPRVVAIAWGMLEAPQRGPSRALSHERIVSAAIEIADTDGLAAVTMQRVAQSLGFTTMSLYRYVSSKDELLTLMQDAAVQLPKSGTWPPPEGWQEGLRQWAAHLRDIYRARPWLLEIPRNAIALLMPNSMEVADRALAVLSTVRITMEQKIAVVLNLSLMVAGFVRLEQELTSAEDLTLDAEGLALLSEVITDERLPTLGPMTRAGEYVARPDSGESQDVDVEYSMGLDWMIAGIERLDAAASE
ncbi:TetR/AcrR family transcriptional regulator [Pseudactinotalea sp. Z1732]|uniref:TetR/AcrR family transcriptional regulator n=1 Tax=Micrococcales TaxID=85006 RepID=UPI003C7E5B4D